MLDQLRLHLVTHLRFFFRSRLVLGLGVAMLGLFALSFVPFVLMNSSGGRFERLKYISTQLHLFAWAYGAVLALLGMSAHVRERATRLIFTRPAPPEVWVASMFLAAFSVAATAHALIAVLTFGMSIAWDVPYQTGFLWMAIDGTFESLIVVALLAMIGVALHPAVAALAAVVVNESILHGLLWMVRSAIEAGNTGTWLRLADWIASGIYAVLPMVDPFAGKTASVMESVRVTPTDWVYLGATGAYASAVAAFCFLATVLMLRRRPL
jgi:hypothetical protein